MSVCVCLCVQARDGTLAIEDMDGGTFTISNGGVFGSMFGTPIINPPQSAILGMHATIQRPVAIDGKVRCCVYAQSKGLFEMGGLSLYRGSPLLEAQYTTYNLGWTDIVPRSDCF